ncbi:hypothetical protein BY996DRAFT_6506947 [Phakopsora pachyrhizi]|nr:hypothetical protein BY996DRAFT_6506947 [Phakopsora pachyrhizi]
MPYTLSPRAGSCSFEREDFRKKFQRIELDGSSINFKESYLYERKQEKYQTLPTKTTRRGLPKLHTEGNRTAESVEVEGSGVVGLKVTGGGRPAGSTRPGGGRPAGSTRPGGGRPAGSARSGGTRRYLADDLQGKALAVGLNVLNDMELEIEDLMESESDSDREEDILLLHDLYTKRYLVPQSSNKLSKTYSPEDLMQLSPSNFKQLNRTTHIAFGKLCDLLRGDSIFYNNSRHKQIALEIQVASSQVISTIQMWERYSLL